MHLIAQPDAVGARPRVASFPAPLCEACNVPMALNGEYAPAVPSAMTGRREYQCRLCGSAMMIRCANRALRA
jgi:predicted RNA-binding Zn-ribbon protein involved in translation (DUF1610 family)